MNLFGRRAPAPTQTNASATADTIMKLRQQLETLEKREAHIEKKIQQQVAEAKRKSGAKDKKGAIFCLKRKKMYEAEIEKLQGARMTLETQCMTLENTQVNVETFQALRTGANQMKAIHQKMNVDAVDATMDDIQEEMATADEIGRAISQPVGNELYDDDELEAELREMEELELEDKLLETGKVPAAPVASTAQPSAPLYVLPEAPSHAVSSSVQVVGDADEDEMEALRKLEASMAL